MTRQVRQDEIVQKAIRNLFLGSVPERTEELTALWVQLNPVFQLVSDVHEDERIIMDAGALRYVHARQTASSSDSPIAARQLQREADDHRQYPESCGQRGRRSS